MTATTTTTETTTPGDSTPASTTASSTAAAAPDTSPTALALASANAGFAFLFANQIADARAAFDAKPQTPFHLLGLGVCAFLEAALGMESGLMGEAGRGDGGGRFAAGLEWEILNADAVVLLGLTHALSESYMGYFQCMYALNAAHSKFTKLFKTVFPNGLPPPPSSTSTSTSTSSGNLTVPSSTGNGSISSLSPSAAASTASLASTSTTTGTGASTPQSQKSLFSRWGGAAWGKGSASSLSSLSTSSASPSVSSLSTSSASLNAEKERELVAQMNKLELERAPEGAVEEMIVAGTAFGFGLFNLVFSLLPKKVQSLVGLLGFKHDRALALRALALSAGVVDGGEGEGAATGRDVHGVFAGLVLMTFHGVVLLLAGYQADEARTLRTYRAIVDSIEARYPTGALWILNRAKILRMSGDAPGAIAVLQRGLEGPQTFVQADTLLVFELAWTLLAQRRHQEAADAFVRLTELNSWYVSLPSYVPSFLRLVFLPFCFILSPPSSRTPHPRSHATYYFIAAGCYISLGNRAKAQELLDAVPDLLARRKINGKDLPTEVLIRKKLEFYKEKQKRRGGDPARYVDCISISTADELGIFWNTYQRIDDDVAEAHIAELAALTPHVALAVPSPCAVPGPCLLANLLTAPQTTPDLDTPDERALRLLLLGIMHRTLRLYAPSRALLEAARGMAGVKTSTWIAGVALFELAVTDLKEGQAAADPALDRGGWLKVLAAADARLDAALGFAGKSDIDLSSRLDSRIALLRDEIAAKRAMVQA
ncbi:mitochondrial outer membrane protein IML2 [Mycena galericulata]|nr:mitochondrial outer membrane protein IML2 [Mycena galericulata]